MKKRTLVAIILLVILVSLGVVALLFLDSSTAKLANTLDEIVFLAETGDFEKADEITQTLLEEYEKAETFYLLCIKSTPLEEI